MEAVLHEIILSSGYIAVIVLMLFNGFASFPPSEVVLCLAGVTALHTDHSILSYILSATTGNLLGALSLYYFTIFFGWGWLLKIRRYFAGQGKLLSFAAELLPDESFVERYQMRINSGRHFWIIYGRCIPMIRSAISIPAAVFGVHPFKFSIYTIIGSLIWAIFWISSGYLIGRAFLVYGKYASYTVAFILCMLIAYLLHRAYKMYRKRR